MKPQATLIPEGTPRDQIYICSHCQARILSFRDPWHAPENKPPIIQRESVGNMRFTCGNYRCWMDEVDAHSELKIAFWKNRKENDYQTKLALSPPLTPMETPWEL